MQSCRAWGGRRKPAVEGCEVAGRRVKEGADTGIGGTAQHQEQERAEKRKD